MAQVHLPQICALLVLDHDGNRVAVKYWDPAILNSGPPTTPAAATTKGGEKKETSLGQGGELKLQLNFEKKIFAKTLKGNQQTQQFDGGLARQLMREERRRDRGGERGEVQQGGSTRSLVLVLLS